MRKSIIDAIVDSELIRQGSTVIVGFSGGPDSLCLLHALVQIQEPYDLTIVPVHINHKLRPTADAEAENAAEICEKLDLECKLFIADCESLAEDQKISTEEAGRNLRYEIFDDVAAQLAEEGKDSDNICIALAHNADDQSETVLFRLLRGTGIHGLAGMPYMRISEGGFMVIRPLLNVPRADIEEYIRDNKLKPNIDESNSGLDYARNRIRNELIPYLEKNYNPNIKQALRKFADTAYRDDAFITDLAYDTCDNFLSHDETDDDTLILDISEVKSFPTAVNARVVSLILTAMGLENKITYELLTAVMRIIYSDNPSAVIDLPEGNKAVREYNRIIFTPNHYCNGKKTAGSVSEELLLLNSQIMKIGEFKAIKGGVYAAFDFDLFNRAYPGRLGELVIRSRQEGDYIAIKIDGEVKRKKIQDFLVDSKIKKSIRDEIALVCIGNEVLWVPPNEEMPTSEQREKGKFSHNFQINELTERVLFLEVNETI